MSNYQLIDPNFNYTERQLRSAFQPLNNVCIGQSENQNGTCLSSSTDITPEHASQEHEKSSSLIFDLNKYKYDYLLSNLLCPVDPNFGKFSSPSGITALPDDRLLVANFSLDSLLLLSLDGVVHQIYRDFPTPKDVVYYSTNLTQAIVATRKDVTILDLETKTAVRRSTLRGFYPWNIQFIREHGVFSACDPSGERVLFLDGNLNQVGAWSFHQPNSTAKIYPYAACFFSNNTSFVLTHYGDICELKYCDTRTGGVIKTNPTPERLRSYAMCCDEQSNCLIADAGNHSLLSTNLNETVQQYTFKSVRDPYSMTFLSDGTLCVTDRSTLSGKNGGIAVMTEVPLATN